MQGRSFRRGWMKTRLEAGLRGLGGSGTGVGVATLCVVRRWVWLRGVGVVTRKLKERGRG